MSASARGQPSVEALTGPPPPPARGTSPGSDAARAPPPAPPSPLPFPDVDCAEPASLCDLPMDVLARLATHLHPRDLLALASTCSAFRPLAVDAVVWEALEQAHLPCTTSATTTPATPTKNQHQTPDTAHVCQARDHFYEQAKKLRGRWHVATGAIVRDVPVHLRSGIFLLVRAHGGSEKPISAHRGSGGPGGQAAYVMKTDFVGSFHDSAMTPLAGSPTAFWHSSYHSSYARHAHAHAHHHAHALTVPNRAASGAQSVVTVPPEMAPAVELDFKVDFKGIPFPASGLVLRIVHAVQLEIGTNENVALDALRVDVLVNGHAVRSSMPISPDGVNQFVAEDILVNPDVLRNNGRINTVTVRYGGRGGFAYWVKDIQTAPAVLGLGHFDSRLDGGSLPMAVPSAKSRNAPAAPHGACKYSAPRSLHGSPTHVSGFF